MDNRIIWIDRLIINKQFDDLHNLEINCPIRHHSVTTSVKQHTYSLACAQPIQKYHF